MYCVDHIVYTNSCSVCRCVPTFQGTTRGRHPDLQSVLIRQFLNALTDSFMIPLVSEIGDSLRLSALSVAPLLRSLVRLGTLCERLDATSKRNITF